ncbi:MAG: hypothetical protein ACTSWL_08250 [Promethearchaeota archaeon]
MRGAVEWGYIGIGGIPGGKFSHMGGWGCCDGILKQPIGRIKEVGKKVINFIGNFTIFLVR